MTGLECRVITDVFCGAYHPSWQKAKLIDHFPNVDSFLVFDADLICLRRWNPDVLFETLGRPFCAVPDRRTDGVYEECAELSIAFPDIYVNGGMTMFGREHKPVWDEVWKRHPKCGRFLEQGALNLALLDLDIQVCRLPKRYNVVTHRGQITQSELDALGAINLHATNLKVPSEVAKIQSQYGLYANRECDAFAGNPA